jgi:ankyrin repeat-rich membrane spanning protein
MLTLKDGCFSLVLLFQDTYRRRQMQRTITRQMSFDLTKLLVTEDWFSDISPQTMRRLLNIVSVTGDFCFSSSVTDNKFYFVYIVLR